MFDNHEELLRNDCHPWCRSTARDEAVRAAEDKRSGPLPTLEEAIAAASPLPGRVEGTHWADWDRLRAERDAAIRERDEANERRILVADELSRVRARVAELESAPVAESATTPPSARGWLTAEEREAVAFAAKKLCELSNCQYVNGDQDAARDTVREEGILHSLLARSTPPEVVLPVCESTRLSTHMMGFLEAIGKVKQALAAAGVKVKEVGSE